MTQPATHRPFPPRRHFDCALITGASAGLGEEYALQLAPRVRRLVLVARRGARLHALADHLRQQFPEITIAVHAADLADATARERLADDLAATGFLPDLLVNNAGLGDYGEFATSDWPRIEAMLRLNIEALTHLTHLFLPAMIRRGGGAVVQVSSLASLLPIPDFAVYAATKAYVSSFAEALRIELREHAIQVLAVCPGPVKTEFGQVARRDPEGPGIPTQSWAYVPRQQVVAESLRALDRNVPRVYPGWVTAAAALAIGLLPLAAIRIAMASRPRRS